MAIQLNERDYLIFKLLTEHKVLLEKHVAWFITHEDKPVLIRDRLRKLFYLDYLLCQRYDGKLPWWTTPTKPLVYMLAPLANAISGYANDEALDSLQQQRYLEIANIRMIFLIAQTEGFIQNFQWTTCSSNGNGNSLFDALVSCSSQNGNHKIGLLSHPELNAELIAKIEKEVSVQNVSNVMIISRDLQHQNSLRKLLAEHQTLAIDNKIIFGIHQDLYKNGIDKVQLFNIAGETINFFVQSNKKPTFVAGPNSVLSDIHAA